MKKKLIQTVVELSVKNSSDTAVVLLCSDDASKLEAFQAMFNGVQLSPKGPRAVVKNYGLCVLEYEPLAKAVKYARRRCVKGPGKKRAK